MKSFLLLLAVLAVVTITDAFAAKDPSIYRLLGKLPPPMSDERDLLGELAHYKDNSRLSCQVEITAALSGLKLTIAEDE